MRETRWVYPKGRCVFKGSSSIIYWEIIRRHLQYLDRVNVSANEHQKVWPIVKPSPSPLSPINKSILSHFPVTTGCGAIVFQLVAIQIKNREKTK